ncbi:hypothetical protein E2C01_000185 [Portunus trituberculatus]|uniref:Uncharacterized protein n=1 Tax=Portunus trituberculatus TaxID=210409 RepID=A0A5B7CFV6_PORTR|nr:hypothetical protein [Portunus trituberculatus]
MLSPGAARHHTRRECAVLLRHDSKQPHLVPYDQCYLKTISAYANYYLCTKTTYSKSAIGMMRLSQTTPRRLARQTAQVERIACRT